MKGEKELWYKLASHLKMSKQRCQQETTSTQFLDWIVYLEKDVNAFHREDYFFANIAREIAQIRELLSAKKPKWLKLDEFLLKFTSKKKEITKSLTREEAAERSKRKWLPWAGIGTKIIKDRNKRKRRK